MLNRIEIKLGMNEKKEYELCEISLFQKFAIFDFLIQLKEDLQKANLDSEVLITKRTTDPWDLSIGSN